MAEEQNIEITAEDDGQRLDRWLKKIMPFGLAQKLIRKGAIRIDGKKAKMDARLEAGQTVRIPAYDSAKKKTVRPLSSDDKAFMKSLVLYDDGDVVVVNKPAGLASQGGTGIKQSLDDLLPALKNRDGLKPKLVHRLDMETSGLMVMARKPETIRELGYSFKNREIMKIYWAITSPLPHFKAGTIRAAIGNGPIKERMVIDEENGKKAQTEYAVIEHASKDAAFIAFWPRTGRTHQIRVHAADALECPILGDTRYDGRESLEGVEAANRLHLHARRLVIPLPGKNKDLDIVAPLPDDLQVTWLSLGFDPEDKSDPFAQGGACSIGQSNC